jgi:hypothetical protein
MGAACRCKWVQLVSLKCRYESKHIKRPRRGRVYAFIKRLELVGMRMVLKTLGAAIALSALGLMTSCRPTAEDPAIVVSKLPALPANIADNLGPTKIPSVWMTKAPQVKPVARATTPHAASKAQFSTKDYFAYIPFPVTVCSPPPLLAGTQELELVRGQVRSSGWTPQFSGTRYYKLERATFAITALLFCRETGGPWPAAVITTESCAFEGADESVLSIDAGPQDITVAWLGGIDKIPPPFHSEIFSTVSETSTCCPGFKTCPRVQGCVPNQVNCDSSPAVATPKRDVK